MYRSRDARVRGTSLIEVLVSLVILATGLTGMMGLQAFSLRLTHEALMVTRATLLMQDMVERVYANPAAMAATEVAGWQAAVRSQLPGGEAIFCRDSRATGGISDWPSCDGVGDHRVIGIKWDDNGDGVAGRRYTVVIHP